MFYFQFRQRIYYDYKYLLLLIIIIAFINLYIFHDSYSYVDPPDAKPTHWEKSPTPQRYLDPYEVAVLLRYKDSTHFRLGLKPHNRVVRCPREPSPDPRPPRRPTPTVDYAGTSLPIDVFHTINRIRRSLKLPKCPSQEMCDSVTTTKETPHVVVKTTAENPHGYRSYYMAIEYAMIAVLMFLAFSYMCYDCRRDNMLHNEAMNNVPIEIEMNMMN